METVFLNTDDDKFIRQTVKFCNNIDKYADTLNLNANELTGLKGDVNIAAYISSRYPSFSPSFIQHSIKALRIRFAQMCYACILNKKFNRYMGIELGIETDWAEGGSAAEIPGSWFLGVFKNARQYIQK